MYNLKFDTNFSLILFIFLFNPKMHKRKMASYLALKNKLLISMNKQNKKIKF